MTITGITGVIAQSVSQRTQEFGLRMALGASQQSVLRMVIGQGLTLVGIGLAIGIVASIGLARVLRSYLYQTTPTDPITFAGVAMAFVIAGTLACLGPGLARDDGRSDEGAESRVGARCARAGLASLRSRAGSALRASQGRRPFGRRMHDVHRS